MDDGLEERVARLEAVTEAIKEDISDLKDKARENSEKIDKVHGRINDLIKNDISHLRGKVDEQAHSREFWAKVLIAGIGGGGIGVTIIECFFKYVLPIIHGG
jgi:septal ring factor EnvC (AmiA/AmiB activator)